MPVKAAQVTRRLRFDGSMPLGMSISGSCKVSKIHPHGQAQALGVKTSSVIAAVGDVAVSSSADLVRELQRHLESPDNDKPVVVALVEPVPTPASAMNTASSDSAGDDPAIYRRKRRRRRRWWSLSSFCASGGATVSPELAHERKQRLFSDMARIAIARSVEINQEKEKDGDEDEGAEGGWWVDGRCESW